MPTINTEKAEKIASILKEKMHSIDRLDKFDNPGFYPSTSEDPELVARYFIVMVAMDHRLHRPGKRYCANIGNRILCGSDLLYYLGKRKFGEDPDFFSPQRLSKVTSIDVHKWLTYDNAYPPDPEIRAWLLRDVGCKLLLLYEGQVIKLLRESNGYLYRALGNGLIDSLKVFRAYEDPVEKKAFLLAKFLERRNLIKIVDEENKRLPIDNHLTRITIRLGLIVLENNILEKVFNQVEVSKHEDILIRLTVREAWALVAEKAGIDPFILDDMLWTYGRTVCIYGRPHCFNCSTSSLCVNGKCIFANICQNRDIAERVNEHRFYNTWYY